MNGAKPTRNARRYPRTEVNIVVDVSATVGQVRIQGHAVLRVLGGGGAYLEIDENCPVGMLLLLRFKLPGDDEEIICYGGVCDGVEGQGAGLEFLGIQPKDRDRLVEFVERHLSDG